MAKIIEGFRTSGGRHCITNALKQIFDYYNYPLSEEMIFGLGSGLSFLCLNFGKIPIISGRIKPFEFEKMLCERLNIDIKCKSNGKYIPAINKTKKLINNNNPVLVYVDMAYLSYLNLGEDNHFGGYAVVLFGYDDEKQKFYVSDRDNFDYPIRTPKEYISNNYHVVDYKDIEDGRSSDYRPFPATNKYLSIVINKYKKITPYIIRESIKHTCDNMLDDPSKLSGLSGIEKFSKEILKWKKFDENKLKMAGITNYFQINAEGGTGGGIFRRMYGDFLIEASYIFESYRMRELGILYVDISKQWDSVSDLMWQLSETGDANLLENISSILREIESRETMLLTELREIVS